MKLIQKILLLNLISFILLIGIVWWQNKIIIKKIEESNAKHVQDLIDLTNEIISIDKAQTIDKFETFKVRIGDSEFPYILDKQTGETRPAINLRN